MRKCGLAVLAGAALLCFMPNAQAVTTTFTDNQLTVVEGSPTPSETKIYFDAAVGTLTGTGHLGSQTGTDLFSFTGTIPLTFANGFATIDPTSATANIYSLDIKSPTGVLWNDMIFAAQGPSGSAATQLSIEALLGGSSLGKVDIANIGSGAESFYTFIISAGVMDELKLTSALGSTGLHQLKQFEVSLIPLPPAVVLFGSALVGLVMLGRRRRNSPSAVA